MARKSKKFRGLDAVKSKGAGRSKKASLSPEQASQQAQLQLQKLIQNRLRKTGP